MTMLKNSDTAGQGGRMASGGKMTAVCNWKLQDHSEEDHTGKVISGLNGAHGIFRRTIFDDGNLTDASFMFATLWQTSFRGATLTTANIGHADGYLVVFDGARLTDANLSGFHGREASFRGAVLRGATLQGAQCLRADFRDADLREACLVLGQFREADFRGADLRGADLTLASLHGARFDEHTNLEGARLHLVQRDNLPQGIQHLHIVGE